MEVRTGALLFIAGNLLMPDLLIAKDTVGLLLKRANTAMLQHIDILCVAFEHRDL